MKNTVITTETRTAQDWLNLANVQDTTAAERTEALEHAAAALKNENAAAREAAIAAIVTDNAETTLHNYLCNRTYKRRAMPAAPNASGLYEFRETSGNLYFTAIREGFQKKNKRELCADYRAFDVNYCKALHLCAKKVVADVTTEAPGNKAITEALQASAAAIVPGFVNFRKSDVRAICNAMTTYRAKGKKLTAISATALETLYFDVLTLARNGATMEVDISKVAAIAEKCVAREVQREQAIEAATKNAETKAAAKKGGKN